ncbi:hypothetical protein EOA23_15940 [Mesorhizobium sp. M2A.F.Ca.ET.042.01.1.1]|nr:hypothetical protein EOA23_15940 [Mesorhizobium sp. M2A.F.Ca.ET.042.01.1.1]
MGGDWMSPPPSPTIDVAGKEPSAKLLISPLLREMPGRAEGGAVPPALRDKHSSEIIDLSLAKGVL